MKTLIRSTAEIRALQAGASLVVLPCKPKRGVITGAAAEPGGAIQSWGGGGWGLAGRTQPRIEVLLAPYAVGDVVGVKEKWATAIGFDPSPGDPIWYEADGQVDAFIADGVDDWRTAGTMPLWAIRIHLEITSVRCGLVSEITEARATGFRSDEDPYWRPTYGDPDSGGNPSARRSFEFEWDDRYGKKYPWASSWAWFFGVKVKA